MERSFHPTTRKFIENGDFPLEHDCIMKVEYIQGSPLRFQYFTTFSCNVPFIEIILSSCSLVKSVKSTSVDKYIDTF